MVSDLGVMDGIDFDDPDLYDDNVDDFLGTTVLKSRSLLNLIPLQQLSSYRLSYSIRCRREEGREERFRKRKFWKIPK
tara:strand:+ start:1371 stop:1604 length:234 start_codon:yes stop_codon:yes gene_type:complete